jgi:hypothetical protein
LARAYVPGMPRNAIVLASLLWLVPGGAASAVAKTDQEWPAPSSPVQADTRQIVPPPADRSQRVRPLGAAARMLLEDSAAKSPTVARLLEVIGQSDLIVYVATGFLSVAGRLDFACAKPGVRFLRITINVPDAEPNLIASLAHELQHAVEIGGAPEVTGAATLARYYRKHGQRICGDEYCTKAAQQIAALVRVELASGLNARK